jgi:hypothetical protein
LLSTLSSEYPAALHDTATAEHSENWKNVTLGDEVTLKNTVKGTYLGRYKALYLQKSLGQVPGHSPLVYDTVAACAIQSGSTLHLIKNARLSSRSSSRLLSAADAELEVNQHVALGRKIQAHNARWVSQKNLLALVQEVKGQPNPPTQLKVKPTCLDEIETWTHSQKLLLLESQGVWGSMCRPRSGLDYIDVIVIDTDQLENNLLVHEQISGRWSYHARQHNFHIDSVTSASHLMCEFTTNLGHHMEIRV